ncbi:MAG: tetratricopeptide repeat protein [Pseudomonadota bacterium]|nr:tetratricopeptide repeat protein [Pseudomonadota bacterium]
MARPFDTGPATDQARTCTEFTGDYARIMTACRGALDRPGLSDRSRQDLMDGLAWAHYYLNDIDGARGVFQQILQLYPNSEDGLTGLAWLAYDADSYDQAALLFARAMNISPNAEVLAGYGAALYMARRDTLDDALARIDAALTIDPDYIWALRRKGWFLEEAGRLAESEAAFRRAIQVQPDDAASLYGLSYVLGRSGKWSQALPYVNRALEERPDYLAALSRRSLVLFNLGRPGMALRDAERMIDADPGWSEGYVRKARALFRMRRAEDAVAALAAGDKAVGYNSFLLYWYARMLVDTGHSAQALNQIARIDAQGDADFHDVLLQTRIALVMGDTPLARQSIDRSLGFRPADKWALYYATLVLVAEGRYDEAEARFDAALQAGLSKEKLPDFIKALLGRNEHARAVKLRDRYVSQVSGG